jgi:hypothetical protein
MPLQLYKIASTEFSTSTSNITFSSIPQGYTDLKLVCSIRGATNANPSFYLVPNVSDSVTCSTRRLLGTGSAALSNDLSTTFFRLDGGVNGTGETANTFTSIEIYIPNYTSNAQKSISFESVVENNATAANAYLAAGLYQSTNAINSLYVQVDGDMSRFSTFSLYGIL